MSEQVFADTFYFIALTSPRDVAHEEAMQFSQAFAGRMVTTDLVLVELADALSAPPDRPRTAAVIRAVWNDPHVRVHHADRELIDRALELFLSRHDKSWGLTDCVSFVVMQDEGIQKALTADVHFRQAGFTTLLRG